MQIYYKITFQNSFQLSRPLFISTESQVYPYHADQVKSGIKCNYADLSPSANPIRHSELSVLQLWVFNLTETARNASALISCVIDIPV